MSILYTTQKLDSEVFPNTCFAFPNVELQIEAHVTREKGLPAKNSKPPANNIVQDEHVWCNIKFEMTFLCLVKINLNFNYYYNRIVNSIIQLPYNSGNYLNIKII